MLIKNHRHGKGGCFFFVRGWGEGDTTALRTGVAKKEQFPTGENRRGNEVVEMLPNKTAITSFFSIGHQARNTDCAANNLIIKKMVSLVMILRKINSISENILSNSRFRVRVPSI